MAQSLSQIYIHLVTGTKYRAPLIEPEVEGNLHAYMVGILKNMQCPALKINSMPDHIHVLFRLSKNYALAKVIENVKKESSKWMKLQGVPGFAWQNGYGAFSVDRYRVEVVRRYIQNQKEHHKAVDYREELEKFMREYDVKDYDPQYFWS